MSDFDIVCRLRTLADVLMIDLHDHAAGDCPLDPIEIPDEAWTRQVETALRVDGFAETGGRLDGGQVVITMRSKRATWAEAEARRVAVRTAAWSAPVFLLDVTVEGVTYTYRANRPDVGQLSVSTNGLITKTRTFRLTFPVQPNPTITGV